MRVLIVGAGVVGLATAWALAKKGHEAVVFDQGQIPNPASASFDQHRMIRLLYPGNPGYARMVLDAFDAWGRLWEDLGSCHFAEVGALALAIENDQVAAGSRDVLDQLGHAYQLLDRKELEDICPFYELPDESWGLLTRPGGVLFAERIVSGLASHLRARGVVLRANSRVTAIDAQAGEVCLEGGGRESGDAVVVCAGAWIGKLLPDLAPKLSAYRQAVCYLEPPKRFAATWRRSPAQDLGIDHAPYVLPPVAGMGLKFGASSYRRKGDPDDSRDAGPDEGTALFAYLARHLKRAEDYRVKEVRICYYTASAVPRDDDEFLAMQRDRMIVISNCTGHMFKFGAVLGEQLARTLAGEATFPTFARWVAGDIGAGIDRAVE